MPILSLLKASARGQNSPAKPPPQSRMSQTTPPATQQETPQDTPYTRSEPISDIRLNTPRHQLNLATPPTPHSTPCPKPRLRPHHHHHSIPTIPLLPPYIPPSSTLPLLEAERLHLLSSLQAQDSNTTNALRTICHINAQLDSPIPLPPHEVKKLRRSLRSARASAEACMRQERWTLNRLGECALRAQQVWRWEMVVWEMNAPIEMTSDYWGGVPQWRPMIPQPQPHCYGMVRVPDTAYAASNPVFSSPWAGEPRQGFGPIPFQLQEQQQPPLEYDNASGITSAATTRRNTMTFPPNTPLNSRQGSISAQDHSISGIDLGARMAQLANSSPNAHPSFSESVGISACRRSEPGLVAGQWTSNDIKHTRYASDNLHAPPHQRPAKLSI